MCSLPYDFMPAVLYAIEKISQGYTETKACDLARISIASFDNYIKNNPQLQEMLYEASERGGDAMADALVDIDNHSIYGHSDAKMARVVSDNIKWVLSKRRKKYADRVQVDVNITADRAITDALAAGRQRAALAHDDSDFLEAVVIEQSEEEILAEILGQSYQSAIQ